MSIYRYLRFAVGRGRPAWGAFATHVREKTAKDVAGAGGELLGLFAPQLGFASDEAVLLLRYPRAAGSTLDFGPATPSDVHNLTPTIRPLENQKLRTGGIYVHRWFTIDSDRTGEFIDLSQRAWGNFEGSYETEIFGLFTAEASTRDRETGVGRLLLLTWYRDHGVWETSREQSRDPSSLFAQRHLLTRSTIGRSSVLVPLA